MGANICAAHLRGSGFGHDDEARRGRQASRRLAALIRAFHLSPDAKLTSRYVTSDEGELERETTVRRWARRELVGLKRTARRSDAGACYRRAYRTLANGLRLRGRMFKRWSARETVASYLEALAHGDERAACRRISGRAARVDLHRLAEAYRVPTISRQDKSLHASCLRMSQRIGQAMRPEARRRFAARALGPVTLTRGRACVKTRRSGFPAVAVNDGAYKVDGLAAAGAARGSATPASFRPRSC